MYPSLMGSYVLHIPRPVIGQSDEKGVPALTSPDLRIAQTIREGSTPMVSFHDLDSRVWGNTVSDVVGRAGRSSFEMVIISPCHL